MSCNEEQRNRRKKDDELYCETHIKGTPNGGRIHEKTQSTISKKITVWYEDIMGIQYYIDDNNNVYKPEDIMNNKENLILLVNGLKRKMGSIVFQI